MPVAGSGGAVALLLMFSLWVGCGTGQRTPAELVDHHFRNGEFGQAVAVIDSMLPSVQDENARADLLLQKGRCFWEMTATDQSQVDRKQLLEDARNALTASIDLHPTADAYHIRSMIHEEMGESELADQDQQAWRELDVTYRSAYLNQPPEEVLLPTDPSVPDQAARGKGDEPSDGSGMDFSRIAPESTDNPSDDSFPGVDTGGEAGNRSLAAGRDRQAPAGDPTTAGRAHTGLSRSDDGSNRASTEPYATPRPGTGANRDAAGGRRTKLGIPGGGDTLAATEDNEVGGNRARRQDTDQDASTSDDRQRNEEDGDRADDEETPLPYVTDEELAESPEPPIRRVPGSTWQPLWPGTAGNDAAGSSSFLGPEANTPSTGLGGGENRSGYERRGFGDWGPPTTGIVGPSADSTRPSYQDGMGTSQPHMPSTGIGDQPSPQTSRPSYGWNQPFAPPDNFSAMPRLPYTGALPSTAPLPRDRSPLGNLSTSGPVYNPLRPSPLTQPSLGRPSLAPGMPYPGGGQQQPPTMYNAPGSNQRFPMSPGGGIGVAPLPGP